MSNIFKTNSRFDALSDFTEVKSKNTIRNERKIEEVNKINSFKNDKETQEYRREKRYNDNTNYQERVDRERKQRQELEEKRKMIENEESLKEHNFPQLNEKSLKNKQEVNQEKDKTSFIDKLKVKQETAVLNKNEEIIKNGWVVLKKDPKTRVTLWKFGVSDYDKELQQKIPNPNLLLDRLAEIHERYVNDYIQLWGEEEYEKMYRFPNYDYDYFDKLDELYEDEMENLHNEEEYDDEYYDTY
jgi:hypothetical protein